jgi:hypothetical protein
MQPKSRDLGRVPQRMIWYFRRQNRGPLAPTQTAGAASSVAVGSFCRVVKDTDILPDLRIGAAFITTLFASIAFRRHCLLDPT